MSSKNFTALEPWADPDEPGMHRTATMDYDVVLEGTIGLELDNGAEVTLKPGDRRAERYSPPLAQPRHHCRTTACRHGWGLQRD
jgi:hypothetical protein